MTVDHHKLNQMVIPIAVARPDVVLLLEQINISLGSYLHASMQILIWKMIFTLYLFIKTTKDSLLSTRPAVHLHCPTSGLCQLCSLMS